MMRSALLLVLCLAAGPTPGQEPFESGILEDVLVDRVVWPVRFQPVTEGGCEDARADQVEVREDGREMRVTELGRHRLPTVHVLLIDTSGSMVPFFTDARQAASSYIHALPAPDRVVLASFDENLRLWVGPTFDRNAAIEALDRIDGHNTRYTSLWDAVYNLLLYLDGISDRKVLVMVTDGCDSLSLPTHTYESTLDLVFHASHLTVLPVAVGGTVTCPYTGGGTVPLATKTYLETLARRTGGQLFEARSGKALIAAFEEIIRRLSQEGYIVWAGTPFGEGPKDRPEKNDSRWRAVRIHPRSKQRCRVTSAGPPSRLVERPGSRRPPPTRARLEVDGDRLSGVVADLLRERGQLYDAKRSRRAGQFIVSRDRAPIVDLRMVEVRLPSFDALRRQRPDPAWQILGLMEVCLAMPACSGGDSPWPPRFMVQGQTFFDIRADLARALLEAPGYGAWARARIRADREQEADRLLEEAAASHPRGEETRRTVRKALLERPLREIEVLRYLGEWLGDIHVPTVVTDLEAEAANEPGGDLDRRLRRAWPLFTRWFGPPTAWRSATLLLPAFDPDRPAVGFRRLHLPVPAEGQLPGDLIPARPVALEFLAWARGPARLHALAPEKVRVTKIRYSRASTASGHRFHDWLYREQYRDLIRANESLWSLRIQVAPGAAARPATAGTDARLTLEVLFFLRPDAFAELVPPERRDSIRKPDARGRGRYDLSAGPFCVRFPRFEEERADKGFAAGLMGTLQALGRDCPP